MRCRHVCPLVLALICSAIFSSSCEAQNLVVNPSFETDNGLADMADGWEQFALGGTVLRVTDMPNTGDAHIRLTGDPIDGANFAVLVQRELPVMPEMDYQMDLFARGDPVDGQVGYRVEFYNAGGGLIGGMFDNNVFINDQLTTDYQEFSTVYSSPANAATGVIVVFWELLNGLTSVDVDDVGFALASAASPGDFDGDGDVDGDDFLVWQRDPGVGSLTDWEGNYGTPALSAVTSVPEPGTCMLLGLAGLCLAGGRRSR